MTTADQQTPPPVLDYRDARTTPRGNAHFSDPRYPLACAAATALVGLVSPPHSLATALAVLALPFIASWYVVVRVWSDARAPNPWCTLLGASGVCCVLLAALAQTVDHGLPMYLEHWRVYGTIRGELYPLLISVASFALLRGALWVRVQRRRAAESAQ